MLNIFKISRPRFWIYILGPFLIGALFSYDTMPGILALFLLYFTFAANLLIYGVNDIFDYETDKLNAKKQGYESEVAPDHRKKLWIMITLTNIPFFFALFFVPTRSIIFFCAFLFFSCFYSAPPIRAKAIPIIDSIFNILYILPGFFAWSLAGQTDIPLLLLFAGWLWCMAMHAYSAIPDIKADTQANIATTATILGAKKTLLYCSLCYLGSALLSMPYLGFFSLIFLIPYAIMMLLSVKHLSNIFNIYTYFPYVNTGVGFGFFLIALIL